MGADSSENMHFLILVALRFLLMLQALLGTNLSDSGTHHSQPEFKHPRCGRIPSPIREILSGDDCCALWETCDDTRSCLCLIHPGCLKEQAQSVKQSEGNLQYTCTLCSGPPDPEIAVELCTYMYSTWIWSLGTHPGISIKIFILSCLVLSFLPTWCLQSPLK